MKKSKLVIVTAILLSVLVVGLALLAVGEGTILKDKKYMKTAEKQVAYITSTTNSDGEKAYYLWYSVDGKECFYDYDYDESKGDYIGKDFTVYYTKNAPEDIFIATNEAYKTVAIIGLVLSVASIILLGYIYIPLQIQKYVIKNGKTELVKINEIIDVIGGQKIVCDSTKIRGNKGKPFVSKRVGRNVPTNVLNSAVTVYYLPKNNKFYYIDTNTIKFRED